MKPGKFVASIITVIILTGLAYNFMSMLNTARSIQVTNITLVGVDLEGINLAIFDFVPDLIRVRFSIYVHNPSGYSFELDRLTYQVYVEDRFLGEGVKRDVYIPAGATRPLHFAFEAATSDILALIEDMIKRGDTVIDYEIRGYVRVPVKLFNIIYITSIDIPYRKKGFYVIPIRIPGMKSKIKGFTNHE